MAAALLWVDGQLDAGMKGMCSHGLGTVELLPKPKYFDDLLSMSVVLFCVYQPLDGVAATKRQQRIADPA